ncbi:hypothetical protein [Brevifollis gellanilyticus]|uniref:Lipoprotein n=1 Tax=Brevifollis gellanilyticus TaxID=748831 RepID=A0A512MHH9_9BACT|nr:hypothetical protein [Brevifollis gellanilyticus]GEP46179.1 hypothetical protein BGE01nite_54700 [Brevifollis gellanilyticus]
MKALLLLSVLISLSSPALARIGETPEQCEARYGKPVKIKAENSVSYQKAGMRVDCEFIDGKCARIYFAKLEKDAQNAALPITSEEAKILMEANSDGTPWTKTGELVEEGFETWKSGELEASHLKNAYSSLSINNLAYRKLQDAKKADEEKGSLKGF